MLEKYVLACIDLDINVRVYDGPTGWENDRGNESRAYERLASANYPTGGMTDEFVCCG
jgi:hypothetical protein